MLINDVVNFCNNEYQTKSCGGCGKDKICSHDCKNCLDDLHYHKNIIRTNYACEHLLDYYVCRYSYKYCSEIIHALKNVNLSAYPYFHILSLGCGGSPDLMAFDYLNLSQKISYKGIDINEKWEKIHNFIIGASSPMEVKYFRNYNVLDFFESNTIKGCNVIFIEYLISFFYKSVGAIGLKAWFDQLARQIVSYKPKDSPMLIIINDADSRNVGRDSFPLIRKSIEARGIKIENEFRRRFKEHNYYPLSIQYSDQKNFFDIPVDFRDKYKVAIKCEAAQLILEVK